MNRGHVFAIAAYAMWGLLPIYWERLSTVPSMQVVAHRIAWSCLVLIPLVFFSGQWSTLKTSIRDPKILRRQSIASILVCANWLGFVWAVTHGKMVESSLGYYINPLLNVLIAVVFLGERLRLLQSIAIMIATCGVVWIGIGGNSVPWIAFGLATSFCLYGIAKKTTKIHPIASLTIETWMLFIPAVAFLLFEDRSGRGAFMHQEPFKDTLLIGGGIATTLPLLCFAAGAQRIPFSTIGLLQYIGPTIQFLLGIWIYHESFPQSKQIGFVLVWVALSLYALDSFRNRDRGTKPASITTDGSSGKDASTIEAESSRGSQD